MPAAFRHGTMVAGLVHVAAPAAKIMPLKAFTANGTAQLSDILRVIYYAANHGATVINMSFSLSTRSVELTQAVGYAQNLNAISEASTGNTGHLDVPYPAVAPKVIGVASVNNAGALSSFSSFGPGTWIEAPGEFGHDISRRPLRRSQWNLVQFATDRRRRCARQASYAVGRILEREQSDCSESQDEN